MKKIIYILLLGFFQLFFAHESSASHIIGGEMNYRCLGNNKYEITLTIYRDCFNGVPPFDSIANVGIFDKNNILLDSLRLTLNPDDTLKVVLSDTCLVIPKNICVHTTTYKGIVELKPIIGGYFLAYQRCCRNKTIANIVIPEKSGVTFGVTISDEALKVCNNSAKFINWPPIFICVNEPIKFDHSASDIDGDSVYYRLCTPFLGPPDNASYPTPSYFTLPMDTVIWKAPYDLKNVLGGDALKINPKTGELTGKPNTLGQFVVGICAEEYRKGKLISTNRRDFQYNIGVCGSPDAAIFAPKIQCDKLEVKFKNKSKNSTKYNWDFGDATTDKDTSSLFEPIYKYPKTGTYKIRLIASPNSACADTTFHEITLQQTTLVVDFDLMAGKCTDSLLVTAKDKSTDPAGNPSAWEWKFYNNNDTIFSKLQNPTFKPWKSGVWISELTVIAKNSCPISVSKDFAVELLDIVTVDTLRACIGEEVKLIDQPKNFKYVWTPTAEFSDPTNPIQFVKVTPEPKKYQADITSASCTATKIIYVAPDKSTPKLVAIAKPDTIFLGKTVQLEATVYTGNYKYLWSPAINLSSEKISNPIAIPTESTTYTVTLTPPGNANCPAVAQARIVVLLPECAEPYVYIPNAFTPNADGKNDILYVRGPIKEMHLVIYDRWGQKVFESIDPATGWDGLVNATDVSPDVFAFYLEVTCFNDKKFVKKGNISLIR